MIRAVESWSLRLTVVLAMVSGGVACGEDKAADAADLPPEGTAAGECSDGADNDGDGLFDCNDDGCAASPYCLCEDGCTELDARDCSGNLVRQCTWGPGGCLRWVEVEDCATAKLACLQGACVGSRCSVSGGGCASDADCGGVNVSVKGHCITLDAGGGDWICGYDARVDSGATVSCEDDTFVQCEADADCPGGVDGCTDIGSGFCGGTQAQGICAVTQTVAPCADDGECTYLADDVCITCGDNATDAPFEECDGETMCASSCRKGGICYSSMAGYLDPCMSTAECEMDMTCALGGECMCVPPE